MTWGWDEHQTLKRVAASGEKSVAAQEKMADAFARVATALEALTQEVKAMREEMSPALDKQKLSTPKAAATP